MPLSNGNGGFDQGYTLVAVSDLGHHVISVTSRQEVCDEKLDGRFTVVFFFSFTH